MSINYTTTCTRPQINSKVVELPRIKNSKGSMHKPFTFTLKSGKKIQTTNLEKSLRELGLINQFNIIEVYSRKLKKVIKLTFTLRVAISLRAGTLEV